MLYWQSAMEKRVLSDCVRKDLQKDVQMVPFFSPVYSLPAWGDRNTLSSLENHKICQNGLIYVAVVSGVCLDAACQRNQI